MPSNFTQHFNLSQWEPGDQVLREDFNRDNATIDAALAGKGNCQVITGSYTGTGKVGEKNPNVITFPKKPVVVMIWDYSTSVAAYGSKHMWIPHISGNTGLALTWSGNTLSWYNGSSSAGPSNQLNTLDKVYYYLAFLEA